MTEPMPELRFIDEPIEVEYDLPVLLEKTPRCPARIRWKGEEFQVAELLAEWQDFRRRGRLARNMTPPHKTRAERVGSWGVGRFFFRVRTACGRVFEIYYDRAPVDAGDRKGRWVLYAERTGSE